MLDLSNENVIHTKKEGIEYIQFRRLLKYSQVIKHAFVFKPLDFNLLKIGEEKLQKNYDTICSELDIQSIDVIKTKQTHSNNVEVITREGKDTFYDNTDALITKNKNIVLPIMVADCISLLIFDPNKNVIANIHSGWRGTIQRIIEITVKRMVEEFNCNTSDIICCIAPSIGKCHFEVEKDVKDLFEKEFNNMLNKNIILKSKENNEKYFIDTVLINRLMLRDLGLRDSNIIESKLCTMCNNNNFYSYRIEKEKAGRNLSIITLI